MRVSLKSRLLASPSNFALSRAEEMRAIDEYRGRLAEMVVRAERATPRLYGEPDNAPMKRVVSVPG